jgi:hypothetical protein
MEVIQVQPDLWLVTTGPGEVGEEIGQPLIAPPSVLHRRNTPLPSIRRVDVKTLTLGDLPTESVVDCITDLKSSPPEIDLIFNPKRMAHTLIDGCLDGSSALSPLRGAVVINEEIQVQDVQVS